MSAYFAYFVLFLAWGVFGWTVRTMWEFWRSGKI